MVVNSEGLKTVNINFTAQEASIFKAGNWSSSQSMTSSADRSSYSSQVPAWLAIILSEEVGRVGNLVKATVSDRETQNWENISLIKKRRGD